MASGNQVVEVVRVCPPATLYATEDVRPGGTSPGESFPVLDFDAATIEYMDFLCRLSTDYAGGGLTFTLPWSASSATSGDVVWGIGIRRIADDAEDVDPAHTYDYNGAADTAASASGELSYPTITFTDGADMDSWAAGEMAMVRVLRDATNAGDTMTGDAELWGLFGKET